MYISSSVSMNLPARVLLKADSGGMWSSSTKQGEVQVPETLSLGAGIAFGHSHKRYLVFTLLVGT